ncbi:hypothetical protein LX36DRAFT_726344 [Colletotrichum falcatum]|nr:hypothetical protein LX36DRAFT_726344 [Colletotrichum falcatum]
MAPEIGSLRALANGESQFVGSSSGVYFINTVKRAFSAADGGEAAAAGRHLEGTSAHDDPSPEDCIVGGGNSPGSTAFGRTPGPGNDRRPSTPSAQSSNRESLLCRGRGFTDDMSDAPVYSVARELVLAYFRIWHPLVPFLHGPDTLASLDTLYRSKPNTEAGSMVSTSLSFTFRCIFNIARLEKDDPLDLGSATIRSPSDILPTLSHLALRCDTASIQALLCAQVYFISTMSLRHASSVSGLILKSIFQSGMHRCPTRQSLGHPSGIQDSDIDVCPPGHADLHEPVTKPVGEDGSALHLPSNHPDRPVTCPPRQAQGRGPSPETDGNPNKAAGTQLGDASGRSAMILHQRRETQAVLEHHVRHSQLVGRILDVFHKSIHARQLDSQTILLLKADVSAFGNDLSQPRLGPTVPGVPSLTPDPTVFPFVSYHYAVLLLNRPSLSLSPRRGEFRDALQTCIGAANTIIHTIHRSHVDCGDPLFWPGYMSAVWMSGLVLALAIRLELCNKAKAKTLVRALLSRWAAARHCEQVLSSLIQSTEPGPKGRDESLPDANTAVDDGPTAKRRRGIFRRDSDRQDAMQSPPKRQRTNDSQSGSGDQERRRDLTQTNETLHDDANVARASPEDAARFFNQHRHEAPNRPATSPALDAYGDAASLGADFAPIQTAFPDRQRDASGQYPDQLDGTGNLFDMFDEATWGSLLDIANGAGAVALDDQ